MRKLILVGMWVSLGACGGGEEPADPAAARAEVAALLPGLIDDSSDALDAGDGTRGMQDLRASMRTLEESFADLPFDFPLADETTLAAKGLVPQTAEERPGAALARRLNETILTDANHEGGGVFRVRGAAICPEDDAGVVDPECVARVDAAELRLRVSRASGGGLNLAVLVGPDRDEPLFVRLRASLLDVELDLAEARGALRHLGAIAGEELELPAVMRGAVAVRLERHAARHVEVALAARGAIEIAGSMASGAYAFSAAARDPLLAVELNAPAGRFTAALDVGAVSLRAPWSAASPDSLATGELRVDLRGATLRAVVDAAGLALESVGLGDGPLTVKLDAATLLAITVSRFDLGIAAGQAAPVIDLDPGLEVEVAVALRPLADAGDAVEAWALDEVFTIGLGAAVEPRAGALRADAGPIDVAAARAGVAVHVAEGQCLLPSAVTAGEHPVLGQLAAGPCP